MVNQSISVKNELQIRLAHITNNFLLNHTFKGSIKIRELVTKMLVPTPKGSVISHTNYGFNMIVNPVIDKGIERAIYYKGTYEAGTLSMIKKCLGQGDIFVDVGSNIGLMSLVASQFVGNNGHVHSFEPEPEIFAILIKNIEINKINNVSAHNIALGSSQKKARIYSNLNKNRGSASLIKPLQGNSEGEEVLIKTLDDFITTNNISNIKMVKIDVEGWELEVLKGANRLFKSLNAPIICIEYSNLHPLKNGKLLDIYNYILSVNNYKIYKLKKGKECPSRLVKITNIADLPYHDNLFCFLPTHLNKLSTDLFD